MRHLVGVLKSLAVSCVFQQQMGSVINEEALCLQADLGRPLVYRLPTRLIVG